MDTLTCTPTTWRSFPATLVSGAVLEAVISHVGGHLACLRRRGEELNPLWQPPWPSQPPWQVTPAPTGAYGDGPEAILLAGICGSNLCCDRFGAPWPGERRPLHGEAGVGRYERDHAAATTFALRTTLPEAHLEVVRAISLAGEACHWSTTVRHHQQVPRLVEWCEHTNLGGDFLDDVAIEASVDWAVNLPGTPEPGYAHLAPEATIPVAEALAVPPPTAPPTGLFAAAAVHPGPEGWWRATNPRLGRRLTARFSPAEFPWLALWTQHHQRTTPPWNGRTRVRGMELSTKPFPEGKPPASRAERYRGICTACAIPPGNGLTKTIRFTWERC